MSSPSAHPATITDKLLFIPHLFGVLGAVLYRCVSYLFLKQKPKKPFKDLVFAALRKNLGSISIAQEQWTIVTSTQDTYLAFAKKYKFRPESTQLNSGLRLHWLGPKTSEKIILFFHGGGYALPCSDGHLKWLYDLQQELSKTKSTSALLVGYTLTPHFTYPQQLQQAAEALNWLVGKRGTRPSDWFLLTIQLVIIMGDSAGGNMAIGLLSHLLHPHPEVAKVDLNEPLGNAVLLSPWITFETQDDSIKRNAETDMIGSGAIQRWSKMFLGSKKSDEYSEPITADASWFKGLDRVVKSVLIWGGAAEILIDSIQAIGATLKKAHSSVDIVVQNDAAHDEFILETMLGYEEKHEATTLVESWLTERL